MPTIQLRRGTAAQWTASNPVLAAGEIGVELDTDKFKVGTGSAAWSVLDYFIVNSIVDQMIYDQVQAHIDDPDAHPIYLKDAPSDGKNYARKNAAWAEVIGGDGVRSAQEYTHNDTPTAPPSSGQLRFNNAAQNSATKVYLHFLNVVGEDVRLYYKDLRAGDVLIVQDKDDGTKYQIYNITAPAVNQTTYAEIPVTWSSGGTALPSGQRVLLLITSRASSGGGAGGTRTTATFTTASVANEANATGTIDLGKAYRLYTITTSASARVRLYTTIAKRDADLTRPMGSVPLGDHGLILEFITDSSSGFLGADLSPLVDGFDGDADGLVPYSVTNKTGATGTITVTFSYIKTEA